MAGNEIGSAASEAHEAISSVVDAALETSETLAQHALEHAREEIDAAHETAERIAEAAAMTAIGQQITDLRRDVTTWLDELRMSLFSRLETVESRLGAMEAKAAETSTVLVATSPPEQSSSIQPISADPPVTQPAVAEVSPAAVVALAEAPIALAKKKAARRLI